MSDGKLLLWLGSGALAASTAAIEFVTFASFRNSRIWYRMVDSSIGHWTVPIALIVGIAGLSAVVAGCIMVCRKTEGQTLLVAGIFVLGAVFLAIAILGHINPEFVNVHIGGGGLIAQTMASVLVGLICIFAGLARL